MSIAGHSGDIGDCIAGLPAMAALGSVHLRLTNTIGTREPMTDKRVALFAPLLLAQPYVESAKMQTNEFVDHNLDLFRRNYKRWKVHGYNLAQMQLAAFGLPVSIANEQWLTVDYAAPISDRPVVFSRSPRYHNQRFPWKKVWEKYHDQAVFVGLLSEHEKFCKDVGFVPYVPTADFLQLARVIAGSKLMVCNQSSPAWVAEGLHKNYLLEVWAGDTNTMFFRDGVTHGWDQNIHLPDVK